MYVHIYICPSLIVTNADLPVVDFVVQFIIYSVDRLISLYSLLSLSLSL